MNRALHKDVKTLKYDVLLPTLFVSLIFPAAAGGWWRFFSGRAEQTWNAAAPSETALPAALEKASQPRNAVLAIRSIAHRGAMASSPHLVLTEPAPAQGVYEDLSDAPAVSEIPDVN
jgi:hypothetical protein